MIIRKIYANIIHRNMTIVFVIGKSMRNARQSIQSQNEFANNADILRIDIYEKLFLKLFNYRNYYLICNLKIIFRYSNIIDKWWATIYYHGHYCSHIALMTFQDDDTILFIDEFNRFIQIYFNELTNKFGCISCNAPTVRDLNSLFYVSNDQWPNAMLPTYCLGTFMIISENVR